MGLPTRNVLGQITTIIDLIMSAWRQLAGTHAHNLALPHVTIVVQ